MTREEQLDWLYRLRSKIYVYMPKEWLIPMNNALDMTIKAIEQEPYEDCISRQAVINGIDNYIEKVQSTGAKDDFISFEELVVKALPPVTPKQEIGHWKRISIDKYVQHAMAYYKCSVCDKDIIGTHNYCPNCGAKMSEIPTSPERNGKEESEVEE